MNFLEKFATQQTNAKTKRAELSARRHAKRPDTQIVCPHCNVAGNVKTKQIKTKVGISGTKAATAVVTMGISVLGTGLAQKKILTEAKCDNCNITWHIA